MRQYVIHPLVVNTRAGQAVITGFCCNEANFPAAGPPIPPGVHINVIDAYESSRRVKEVADILIPLHDLAVGRQHSIPA
jgi:N-acyl homoserine lactone hydrolase